VVEVLMMLEERLVDLAFDCREHLEHLTALGRRYANRRPDLADLCLIRMSELYPRYSVVTAPIFRCTDATSAKRFR
jgi:hypothetical protein